MKVATRLEAVLAAVALSAGLAGCGASRLAFRSANIYDTIITVTTPAVTNVDPVTAVSYGDQLYGQMVYQTLLGLNRGGQPIPELAKSWRQNRRHTRYTLFLNPFAKWWNGRPVTASNVVWSLRLERSRGSGFVRANELSNVARVTAVSPTTVQIDLKKSDPNFAANVLSTRGGLWILPSFLLNRLKSSQVRTSEYLINIKNAVGTGPFRPIRQTPTSMTWAAYPHYFLGPPRTKYLRWSWASRGPTLPGPHGVTLGWTHRPDSRYPRRYYHAIRVPGDVVWALTANGSGTPWLDIAQVATVRNHLAGPAARLGSWRTSIPHGQAALSRVLEPLGYTRIGSYWVSSGHPNLSVSLTGPDTRYGRLLVRELAAQWQTDGIVVTTDTRHREDSVGLELEPILLRPSSEPLSSHLLPLVQPSEYWYVARNLHGVFPNPWEPFQSAAHWQVMRTVRS